MTESPLSGLALQAGAHGVAEERSGRESAFSVVEAIAK